MIIADEPHCRIGKIKFRNGANVRVFDERSTRRPESETVRNDIVENAKTFSVTWPDMAGYAIFVWSRQGYWSTSYRVANCSPYPSIAIPTLAKEGLREDMTTNSAVAWINKQISGGGPKAS